MVRFGGISLVVAGVIGISVGLLFVWLTGTSFRTGSFESTERLWTFSEFFGLFGEALILVGLVGVYALLAERRGLVGVLARMGFLLVAVFTVVYVGLWGYQLLAQPLFPPSGGISLQVVASLAYSFVGPAGFLLLGVAALWVRALGRWRGLLLIIALMSTPLPNLLLFHLFYSEEFSGPGTWTDLLVFEAPQVVVNLAWVLLGLAMWGAVGREEVMLAWDRRLVERANLERARRLYAEAWGGGDLDVVDELVSPDLFDRYRGERGRDGFKRGVADLRRSFPDLRFGIQAQKAEGDEVVTDWKMGGTDKGGVLWYPPTGKRAEFAGTFTDRFFAGRLVEHDGTYDRDALLAQLGLPRSG